MEAKEVAMDILYKTLKRADPYNILKNNCFIKDSLFKVFGYTIEIKGDIYLISFGKAASSMAKAIVEILGDNIKEGLVVTKYGYAQPFKKIEIVEAGHPVPDKNSVRGAQKALEIAHKAKENDLVIVLISGGGSALMTKPIDPITLDEMKEVTSLLLECGANIYEINTVRKHISQFKGGRLLEAIHPAKAVSIILSDVVGDPIEAIASGPTAIDPTTYQDAYKILKSYRIWDKCPKNVKEVIKRGMEKNIEETLKSYKGYSIKNIVIGSAYICEITAKEAEKKGLKAYVIGTEIEGEAFSWGLVLGSIIKEIKLRNRPFSHPCAIIGGGEVTVTLSKHHGTGGPNQEVALASSIKIAGLENVAILSVDTDGTDGPTDVAGGIVEGNTFQRLRDLKIDVKEMLLKHDTYNALRKINAFIKTGATGTNMNDLYLAVIL